MAMTKTIGQIKTTISQKIHGTTLNKIGDFNVFCRDAAEIVLTKIDPQETKRKALLTNAVYDQVYDYALPTDFKAPSDLNKQAQNVGSTNDTLSRTYGREFANRKRDNQFAVVWEDGVQYLRFARYLNYPATLNTCDSITTNGTWTIGGNASNLAIDTINYISGTGSLKANVSSSGSVVNVILRVGNNSSNYYEKTITSGHFEAFKTGWNLCRFDFSSATQTGSVDMSTIDYIRVTVTYNTNQTAYYEINLTNAVNLSDNYDTDGAVFLYTYFNSITSLSVFGLDSITANIGVYYEIDYYSNCLFRTTSGSWIEQPTSDTDIINLSTPSYKIFEAELCKLIVQQVQGAMGAFDFTYWENLLEGDNEKAGLYDLYLSQFPSERFEGQTSYYNVTDDFPDPNGSINGQPISYYS